MQVTDFGDLNHLTAARRLDRSGPRAVHVKRQVFAPAQIVVEVATQDSSEVCISQHDDVIETLAPDTADQSLGARFREPQGFCHGRCWAPCTIVETQRPH